MARRTAAEAEVTRLTILAEARTSFATEGYAAASTTAVADRAGVSRGALYHHYADKAALFEAVFVQLVEEFDATVSAAAFTASDVRGAVLAGARASFELTCRPEYRRIALADGAAVLGLERWHEIDQAVGLRTMQLGLDALADESELDVDPSPALARALFGALTELGRSCARGDLTVDEAVDAFALLLDRLAPAAQPGGSGGRRQRSTKSSTGTGRPT